MSQDCRHHFPCSGDLPGVGECGWEKTVPAIVFRLSGTVRVHLAERLHEYLATVIVFPAGIDHPSVIEQCRV